jgi:hypothetical protein
MQTVQNKHDFDNEKKSLRQMTKQDNAPDKVDMAGFANKLLNMYGTAISTGVNQ